MPQYIEVKGQTIEFPDGMSVPDIEAAIKRNMMSIPPEKPSAFAKGRAEGNPVIRGLMNVVQGPTFGFGDEIMGAAGALKTPFNDKSVSENYAETRDYARGVQDKYREDFPIGSALTQLAAAAPLIVANPLGKLGGAALSRFAPRAAGAMNPTAQVTGVAGNTGRAAVAGAGYGAVSGAGESTGGIGGAVRGAATGAAFGAATSGAMQPVAQGLGAVAGNVSSRFSDSSAGTYAQQKIAEAFSRDGRGSVIQSNASNPVDQALARFRRLGPEASVTDAGGQNVRSLLDINATLPGRTKDATEAFIRSRQAGRGARLTGAANSSLGTNLSLLHI